MSLMSQAVLYVQQRFDAGVIEVLQRGILRYVSNLSGSTMEQVRGTICKANKGLRDPNIMKKYGFHSLRTPARIVKGLPKEDTLRYQSYDDPIKFVVRDKIIDILIGSISKKCPNIVTFAGHEGLCVKHFLDVYPHAKVFNVEKDESVLADYKLKKLPSFDFNSDFNSFYISRYDQHFDLVYYDSMSYLCEYIHKDLTLLNLRKNVNVLAVTIQDLKNFRNAGAWVDWAKDKFGRRKNPTRACIKATMSNYDLIDELPYRKSNVKSARGMRVYIFRRKKRP